MTRKDWKGLRSVMRIESWRTEKGREPTFEKRYAITSRAPNAKALARSQRAHWSVENQNHWMLDVYFGEDASRVREGHA